MMSLSGSWRLAILQGGLAFVSLAVLAMLSQGQAESAATITVTTADDELNADGDCSPREALQAANTDAAVDACSAGSGADTVVMPAGTYSLSIPPDGTPNDNWDGDLDILGDVTINGAGAGGTIINGNVDRVFDIDPFGVGGLTVEISGLTIASGSTTGSGGGILNRGALTLNDSEVSGNTASGSYGGGIYGSGGTLTLNSSTVSGNTAASYGGGIYGTGGTLTLNSSTVSGNTVGSYGGGIYGTGGTFTNSIISGNTAGSYGGGIYGTGTFTNSTINGNTANSRGGGIYRSSGTLTLDRSTVSGNTATVGDGGGIYGRGTFTDSTISGNTAGSDGGGIYHSGGTLTLDRSTVSGNTATGGDGGGILGDGPFTNSTISGNTAGGNGGGISVRSGGTLTLTNVTVSHNGAVNGGGIFNPASATLKNTIVANSTASADCSGVITSDGHNLVEDPTGCTIIGDTTGNIIGQDPKLGPLADNGGPTQTHALLPGSPAIDAGDNVGCPGTDQRGFSRPKGAFCDIGAYESEGGVDTDGDGMPDAYEDLHICLDPEVPDADDDDDNDGIPGDPFTNIEEMNEGTDPCDADTDGDGFNDGPELFMGTDAVDACGTDCWAPDFNSDHEVDVFDILILAGHFNCDEGQPCYGQRYDLNADRTVDIFDILIWAGYFKQTCTP